MAKVAIKQVKSPGCPKTFAALDPCDVSPMKGGMLSVRGEALVDRNRDYVMLQNALSSGEQLELEVVEEDDVKGNITYVGTYVVKSLTRKTSGNSETVVDIDLVALKYVTIITGP